MREKDNKIVYVLAYSTPPKLNLSFYDTMLIALCRCTNIFLDVSLIMDRSLPMTLQILSDSLGLTIFFFKR